MTGESEGNEKKWEKRRREKRIKEKAGDSVT